LTARRLAVGAALVSLALFAQSGTAAGQNPQTPAPPRLLVVAIESVSMRERPASNATIVQTLYRGEQLEIIEATGDWFHVRVRNSARTGWVNRVGVQPVTAAGQRGAPPVFPTQPGAPIRRPPPKPPRVGLVGVNGGVQMLSRTTTDVLSVPQDSETATFTTTQHIKSAAVFDVNAGMVRGSLGFLIGFSTFHSTDTADISGSVPHPFFFNQPRTLSGTVPLSRTENALYIDVLARVPLSKKADLDITVGPSIFFLQNDFLSQVTYTDEYPYDSITFLSAKTIQSPKTALGFNAGADVSYWLSKNAGVGGFARYSIGSADWQNAGGTTTNVKPGGLQVGGGLRLKF
jgi:hypothetical protein